MPAKRPERPTWTAAAMGALEAARRRGTQSATMTAAEQGCREASTTRPSVSAKVRPGVPDVRTCESTTSTLAPWTWSIHVMNPTSLVKLSLLRATAEGSSPTCKPRLRPS